MSSAARIMSRRLLAASSQLRKANVKHNSGKATRQPLSDVMVRTERMLDPEASSAHGQSRVTMISLQDDDSTIYITKYSPYGFSLQNGVDVFGPCVFFPTTCFSWRVMGFEDIHEGSLSLFTMLEPKPDLLIIGTGSSRCELSPGLVSYLRKHRINFEVLTTDQAIATFNFQNNDQRWSVAALLPPAPKNATLTDMAQKRLESRLDQTALPLDMDVDTEKLSSGDDDYDEKLLDEMMSQSSKDKLAQIKSPLGEAEHFGLSHRSDLDNSDTKTSSDSAVSRKKILETESEDVNKHEKS